MRNNRLQPLYKFDNKRIYYSDLVNTLRKAGVKKGDVVFIHSDISTFGKLCTFDRNFLLQTLIDSIKEGVGNEGTIIMPTFTSSFCKNKPYDVKNTKSTVGVLTEYFRKQPGVSRTIHPNHSVAIWGKHKRDLLNISKDTFDKASIFGKLHQIKGKIVFFGVPFRQSCTYIHYIEQMHGVPYRYMRKFKGKIINGDRAYEDEFSFYYRYIFIFKSSLKLEKHLLKKGLLKVVKIGNSMISVIDSDDLFKEEYKLLDEDIYFLLKNDPIIFKLFNNCICFFLKYLPWPFRLLDRVASNFFYRIRINKKST